MQKNSEQVLLLSVKRIISWWTWSYNC